MNIAFLVSALAVISAVIALTVEAIKKILASVKKKYNSTVLAVIVSVIISTACSAGYIVYNSIKVNAQVVVVIIAVIFLSFLCATVGYDKVVKEIFRKEND